MTQVEKEAWAPAASRLALPTLTTMVVGSMAGAGALIAWAVAGTGMLMPAFVFQTLAVRRPDLNAGGYAYGYAKAGFANTWVSSRRSAPGRAPASASD